MARRVFPVLTLCALAACAATAPGESPSYTVGLLKGQRSVISSEQLSLDLSSVDDSRCPPKVQCVQAGRVSVTVRLQRAGEASELVTLGMPATSGRPGEASALGYRVALQDVSPRPAEDAADAGYRVILKVQRADSSR